jgi:DNA recombination protein RmuC
MTVLEIVLGSTTVLLTALTAGMFYYITQKIDEEPEMPEIEVDPEKVRGAVTESWQELELSEKLEKKAGTLEKQAKMVEDQATAMQDVHSDIESMLKSPQKRGSFGEKKLEDILAKQLPDEMYGFQDRVAGKRPDAYVETASGTTCIDSKFPLDNYRKMVEAEDEKEGKKYARKFRSDAKDRLEEVTKYVRPDEGTTEYAYEFIPSESVYHYLVQEEYELLEKYTSKGVQVVSPLTLNHKLQLIRSDHKVVKLSQEAKNVQKQLQRLENRFKAVETDWKTFYKHIKNARNKADEVEKDFESLKREFDQVKEIEETEEEKPQQTL